MKKSILYIFIVCGYVQYGIGQKIIKINVLFPVHMISQKFGGGLELALDLRTASRVQLSSAININSILLENTVTDGPVHGNVRIESKHKFQKAGARCSFKFYKRGNKDDDVLTGFNHGPFTELSYAQRVADYQFGNDWQTTIVDGAGLFFGLGYRFGYTFRAGNWIIEPNAGLGWGIGSTGLTYPRTPEFFDENAGKNNLIRISPSHLQLHIGYILGQ